MENDAKQIAWFPAPYLEELVEAVDTRENPEEGNNQASIQRSYAFFDTMKLSIKSFAPMAQCS